MNSREISEIARLRDYEARKEPHVPDIEDKLKEKVHVEVQHLTAQGWPFRKIKRHIQRKFNILIK